MKHLKTKLMASVAMLMVATVMLSSASFAWFTISTAPEVKGVSTQLATNGNLEMALARITVDDSGNVTYTLPSASTDDDTGKNITWGNNVDLSSYFATASDAVKKLRPVSFATGSDATKPTVSAPKFGSDGRMEGKTNLTAKEANVSSSSADAGKLIEYRDTDDTTWAYRADFMIRTNTAGNISLADAARDLGNNTQGAGCFIKDKTDGSDSATYLKDIRIYAVINKVGDNGTVGDNVFKGTLLYNKNFETDTLFTAEANQIYVVQTYYIWDGAELNNSEMATKNQNVVLNLQFEHTDSTGADDLKSLYE